MSSHITFTDRNDRLVGTVSERNGRYTVTLEDLRSGQVSELSPGSEGYSQLMKLASTIRGDTHQGVLGHLDRPASETINGIASLFTGNNLSVDYSVTENGQVENGQRIIPGNIGNLRGSDGPAR